MLRFTALAVDDDAWAESCTRIANEAPVDGVQCSDSAYYNMTKFIGLVEGSDDPEEDAKI